MVWYGKLCNDCDGLYSIDIYVYKIVYFIVMLLCKFIDLFVFIIIIIMKLYFFLKSLDYVYNLFVLYVGYVWFFYLDVFKGLVFWELLFFGKCWIDLFY